MHLGNMRSSMAMLRTSKLCYGALKNMSRERDRGFCSILVVSFNDIILHNETFDYWANSAFDSRLRCFSFIVKFRS